MFYLNDNYYSLKLVVQIATTNAKLIKERNMNREFQNVVKSVRLKSYFQLYAN